jgi:hypothetical protein
MLLSSGGILYLIFQDIAPMSKLQKSWFPALGVNFGFLVGMIGQKNIGITYPANKALHLDRFVAALHTSR